MAKKTFAKQLKIKMKNKFQSENEEIILLRDKEWSLIDGEVCKVIEFTPLCVVKNGKIQRVDVMPYASIRVRCKKIPHEIIGFINHREDFKSLWAAFRERGVKRGEEVLVVWSKRDYRFKCIRFLSFLLPKLRVMICPKGAFELITDPNSRPELQGEARFKAEMPIIVFKSLVLA